MKLHLPTKLRSALLTCLTAAATLTTTVGTGTIAGGAFIATLASDATAQAADVSGTGTADDPYVITSASGEVNLTTYTDQDYVRLNITGGYLPNSDGTIAAHVIIDNFKLTDVNKDRTYTFTNTVRGSGEFSFSKGSSGGGQAWDFQGDVSGFTGTINISGNGSYLEELKFTGGGAINATSINVADTLSVGNTIGRADGNGQAYATTVSGAVTAGTLNVNGETDTAFSGAVSSTTLNINSTASFSGDVTAETLNLSGTVAFSGESTSLGTVNLADGASLSGGSATTTTLAQGAGATLGRDYTTTGLTMTADSTLNIAEEANVLVTGESQLAGTIDVAGTLHLQGTLSLGASTSIIGAGSLDLNSLTNIIVGDELNHQVTEQRDESGAIMGWTLTFDDVLSIDGDINLSEGSDAALAEAGLTNANGTWSLIQTVLVNGWDVN